MFATQPESFGGDQRQWSFGRVQVNVDVGQIDPASLADGGQCLPAKDMRRRWSEHSLHQLMIDQVAYLKLVPLEAATNSSSPGSSRHSKLTLKYSELVICVGTIIGYYSDRCRL